MQKLQLSIPEPCHQNWQQMTATDQGRFCKACAKEVIDFSSMTDIQVLNYFTNITHEKVCGRALPEQLERTLSRPAEPKKRLFWYWNYFVMFFMFFAKGNSAKAQSCTKPATEISPANNVGLRGDVVVTVGGQVKRDTRQHIVIGKVTDKDGKPVSFASIKIKGLNSGVAADENGVFKINTAPNSVLEISAVGFKMTDFPVANQTEMKITLANSELVFLGGAVVVGYTFREGFFQNAENQKLVALLSVKDSEKGVAVNHATIIFTKKGADKSEIVYTDAKGLYKLRGIKHQESFDVKVEAEGYEPNEFTIDASDFKDRKKEWEILLRKKKTQSVKVTDVAIAKTDKRVRIMGGVVGFYKEPLYVLDGVITKKANDIKSDDIENITVLKGTEAMALFGSDGLNGAIVITTKKIKCKVLDTVTVKADNKRIIICTSESTSTVMGAAIKGVSVKKTITDSLKAIANKITGAIKTYPNPVLRGQQFSIALKLKQSGLYQMQITDAAGRIVLQKPINANLKEVTEKIIADTRWSSGVYYVSIMDNKNKLISSTSFIFE